MRQTQRLLMGFYLGMIALTMLQVIVYETGIMQPGFAAGDAQMEFLQTTIMELATLAGAFLGLRLFKFRQIHNDLVSRKALALMKWGVLRLLLIEGPMLCNTFFYYMYLKATFGYLAIIMALCLPFVYPSMSRCEAETSEEA